MPTFRLSNKRQLSIERTARVVGSIYNASGKPNRRFESEPELYVDGNNELVIRRKGAEYSFPTRTLNW